MKKPMYSIEEVESFSQILNKTLAESTEDNRNYDDAILTVRNSIEEHLNSPLDVEDYPFDVFHSIAHEAYVLEMQAKELRKIVRTFKKPIEELPTEINSDNPVIKAVAHWRLSLGR